MRTLVFGASGHVATYLVPHLVDRGHRVRAAARDRDVLLARAWEGVEAVGADALAPATLPAALAGVEVAFYLVHSMAAGRDFGQLDVRAAANFRTRIDGLQARHYLLGEQPHILLRQIMGHAAIAEDPDQAAAVGGVAGGRARIREGDEEIVRAAKRLGSFGARSCVGLVRVDGYRGHHVRERG